MNKSLFTGRTVIELGHAVAGPFTASLMGDFGAEVIKIEEPGKGDMWRQMGPSKDGYPLTWLVTARNKKSVTINLMSEKGQALVREMVKRADVVLENFRPGTVEKWGLGWQDLHSINPKLIMLMVSGYGQTGPLSRKPGFGVVGEAMSGAIFMTGFPDKPPTFPGFSLGDLTTGLMGAFIVAGALHRRATDGDSFQGECIDLALYESLFRMIEWQIILHDQVGLIPERKGNGRYPGGGPAIFQSSDGRWLVGESRKQSLLRFLEKALGAGLASDPQKEDEAHLYKLTEEWMAQHTAQEILRVCEEADVVAAVIMSPEDMVNNEQFLSRGSIATVHHPALGDIKMAGVMPLLTNYPGAIRHPGPAIGEYNEEVLIEWLGISRSQYDALKAEGVI